MLYRWGDFVNQFKEIPFNYGEFKYGLEYEIPYMVNVFNVTYNNNISCYEIEYHIIIYLLLTVENRSYQPN